MDFNHTGQVLVCIAVDGTILTIPLYFLLLRQDAESKETDEPTSKGGFEKLSNWVTAPGSFFRRTSTGLRKGSGINEILSGKLKFKQPPGGLVWWHLFSGTDYAIVWVGSNLHFVSMSTFEDIKVLKLKTPIVRVHLVTDPSFTYKYLLIQTDKKFFKLALEHEVDYHAYDTVLEPKDPLQFQMHKVPFNPKSLLSIQHSKQGQLVGVYNPTTSKLEVLTPLTR